MDKEVTTEEATVPAPIVEQKPITQLSKEEINNIIVILGSYKGYNVSEGVYMNNVVLKLQNMAKLIK